MSKLLDFFLLFLFLSLFLEGREDKGKAPG